MLPPENKPLSKISKITGVSIGTLKKWQQELRGRGHAAPAKEGPSDKWSSEDKFLIVVETMKQDKATQKELRKIKKELQRKESALAETAALLVLQKKAEAIWGTRDEEN